MGNGLQHTVIVVPAILTEALELIKWSGGMVGLG